MKLHKKFTIRWQRMLWLVGVVAMLLAEMGNTWAAGPLSSEPAQGMVNEEAACLGAAMLLATGADIRSLDRQLQQGQDWVKFTVQAGQRYQINTGAMRFTLFDDCQSRLVSHPVNQGRIAFSAQRSATLYARIEPGSDVSSSAAHYQFAMNNLAAVPPAKIPLAEAPAALHRHALDMLEENRQNPTMPDWKDARLASEVRLLYRPDMTTVAYYEFLVEKPGTNGYEPAGFFDLAAGTHDYPVPNWSPQGLSPTQQLEDMATTGNDAITQFYKLDLLSYAAEYEEPAPLGLSVVATDALTIGQLPPKLAGADALPLDFEPTTTEIVWTANVTVTDDLQLDPNNPISVTRQILGDEEPVALSEEDWGSWEALKQDYKEGFGLVLDGVKQDASEEWAYLADVGKYGEALLKGESRTIRAMGTMTVEAVEASGAAVTAGFVQQEALNESNLPKGVRITVIGEPAEAYQESSLDVTIRYSGGVSETKRFLVINPGTLQAPNQLFLPMINKPGTQQELAAAQGMVNASGLDAATQVHFGPRTTWWAAGTSEFNVWPFYTQILPNTRVNNRTCHSGCTPTAWAMLFAWGDRRAEVPGSGWTHRKGIYRENGGTGIFNAVAPLREADDRGIENVMMELGRHMGTYCAGTGGATPWDRQGDAQRYLTPRTGATVRVLNANGWWIFGTSEDDTSNRAISIVKSGRPAVIMTPGHSPMAIGYAESSRRVRHCFIFCWYTTEYNREFFANWGWGGSNNHWIPARTRVAGEIIAN